MTILKQSARTIYKGIVALLAALFLVLLGGVWRLMELPLRLPVQFDTVRSFIQQQGLHFEEIYLFTPSLWSLPGVLIQGGRYRTDSIDLQCRRVLVSWKIRPFFSHKKFWKINHITLENPVLSFTSDNQSSTSPFSLQNLPLSLPMLVIKDGLITNTPSGHVLPPHRLNGTFHHCSSHTTGRFHLDVLTPTPFSLSGDGDFRSGILKGKFALSNGRPSEWLSFFPETAPESLKNWCAFLQHPIPRMEVQINGKIGDPEFFLDIITHLQTPFIMEDGPASVPISSIVHVKTMPTGFQGNFSLEMRAFPWEALSSLWPPFLSPVVRNWCVERIQGGTGLPISLQGSFSYDKEKESFALGSLQGTLGVRETTVRYMDTLPPVEKTSAKATFSTDDFSIQITNGHTRNLEVQKGLVRFSELQTDRPQGLVDLFVVGPLEEALWLADHPPLSFASQYQFDPTAVSGRSATHLVLKFPTQITPTLQTIQTTLQSKVSDFSFKKPLLGQKLIFKEGDFILDITKSGLSLKGRTLLNGTPCTLAWTETSTPRSPSTTRYRLEGTFPLKTILPFTPSGFKEFLKTNPDTLMAGGLPLALDYQEKGEESRLSLAVNLWNAKLQLPSLSYKKKFKTPGMIAFSLLFKKGIPNQFPSFKIKAPNLLLEGSGTFSNKGDLKTLLFSSLNIHPIQGAGALQKMEDQWILDLEASSLDLAPFLDTLKSQEESASTDDRKLPLTIKGHFQKIILKNGVVLPSTTIILTPAPKGRLFYALQAKEGNQEVLDLFYGTKNDQEIFSLKTTLFDQIAKGLDWTQTLSSDKVDIEAARPSGKTGLPFTGKMSVQGLRVKGAPFMAKLLSLASLEGLLSTLRGQGIFFITGDAEFEYLKKKVALKHLSLASSSLGLTGKGYLDFDQGTIDASGYIIPANLLNQIIGSIPLIGPLLSGNSKEHKGLVSVSYTMKGPLADPVVSSNPLSILAPNFIKGLFSSFNKTKNTVPTLSGRD